MVLVEGVRQQASPAFAPHKAQTPLEHFVPGAVHAVPVETLVLVLVLQQGLPGPPQAPVLQLPLLHVPCNGKQLAPLATQTFEAQQPLFAQEFPAQQIWPGPPQAVPGITVPPEPLDLEFRLARQGSGKRDASLAESSSSLDRRR